MVVVVVVGGGRRSWFSMWRTTIRPRLVVGTWRRLSSVVVVRRRGMRIELVRTGWRTTVSTSSSGPVHKTAS